MSEKIFNAIRKINPNAHMIIRGNDVDSCEIQWLENTTPISKEDIKAEMTELPTLKEEATAKENLKASAKAKLIAGEPLTEEEANTVVL